MNEKIFWLEGEEFLKNTDDKLAEIINKYGHTTLEPIEPEKYYITLINGILAQQVSSEISQRFLNAFIGIFGETPTADEVLAKGDKALLKCDITPQKITYIKDFSQAIVDKNIEFAHFSTYDDTMIIKELTQVKGFGRWTAEIFLILALNRADVLPADDFGLKKAIQKVYDLPKIPQKRNEVAVIAEKWRPWRSLATWYLWKYFSDL